MTLPDNLQPFARFRYTPPKPDGSREFTCIDCGINTVCIVDDGFDADFCAMCRWIGERPWLDQEVIDRLRGRR